MRIIVSDTSALIDLKKGRLLDAFLGLPYEFIIPAALLDTELLSFSKTEITALRKRMTVATLDGKGMEAVQAILADCPALSTYDGIAFVVAQERPGCIMLTGDRRLRERAETFHMECHGVLWVIQEIEKARLASANVILKALLAWQDDFTVRLPRADLDALITRFKQ